MWTNRLISTLYRLRIVVRIRLKNEQNCFVFTCHNLHYNYITRFVLYIKIVFVIVYHDAKWGCSLLRHFTTLHDILRLIGSSLIWPIRFREAENLRTLLTNHRARRIDALPLIAAPRQRLGVVSDSQTPSPAWDVTPGPHGKLRRVTEAVVEPKSKKIDPVGIVSVRV